MSRPKDLQTSANDREIVELNDQLETHESTFDNENVETLQVRRSSRERKIRNPLDDFIIYLVEGSRDVLSSTTPYCFNVDSDPKTYSEAISSQDIRRVLRYLKSTLDYGLTYSGFPSVLEGFSDASWITDKEDDSSKQTCIVDSTMAAEFIALASASEEAEWLRNLMIELPLLPKSMPPVAIHCDSNSELIKAYSQVYNGVNSIRRDIDIDA
ncbi:uncharacterized protein LOC110732796 [Chenopodium quinoa]|uniref:uncharacterized protein LOC110732796 n=1 Tax=Chenopodium quinoa TaxID=63459 RepID=UPI000B775E14|nr:uncharacterized protein LOC110732796 [Chenopodium quinoa]